MNRLLNAKNFYQMDVFLSNGSKQLIKNQYELCMSYDLLKVIKLMHIKNRIVNDAIFVTSRT